MAPRILGFSSERIIASVSPFPIWEKIHFVPSLMFQLWVQQSYRIHAVSDYDNTLMKNTMRMWCKLCSLIPFWYLSCSFSSQGSSWRGQWSKGKDVCSQITQASTSSCPQGEAKASLSQKTAGEIESRKTTVVERLKWFCCKLLREKWAVRTL